MSHDPNMDAKSLSIFFRKIFAECSKFIILIMVDDDRNEHIYFRCTLHITGITFIRNIWSQKIGVNSKIAHYFTLFTNFHPAYISCCPSSNGLKWSQLYLVLITLWGKYVSCLCFMLQGELQIMSSAYLCRMGRMF